MAEPTLGELVKMQEELGSTKRLRRSIAKSDMSDGVQAEKQQAVDYPRLYESTENGPREEPATLRRWKQKYGSRYRTAMQTQRPTDTTVNKRPARPRDPRFDARCGEYVPEVFRANYSFVKDMRENEISAMKKEIDKISKKLEKSEKDEDEELVYKKAKLKQMVKSSQQRLTSEQRRVDQYRLVNEVKRKEALESAKEGRHPHFMNRSELRQLKLATQYRQLREAGEVDKYLDKKRQKAAQEVRRFRPRK